MQDKDATSIVSTPAKPICDLLGLQEFEEEMESMQEKAKKQQAPPEDGMESKEQGQEEGEGEGEAGEDAEAQQGEAGGSAEAPVSGISLCLSPLAVLCPRPTSALPPPLPHPLFPLPPWPCLSPSISPRYPHKMGWRARSRVRKRVGRC